MAKLEKRAKQNPKLEKRTLSDGRISLYLNYYLGREETPVLDDVTKEPILYETGPMKGKPKYKVTHHRKKEYLDLYLLAHPRKPADKEKNRQTLALAEKIRFEKEQQFKESQTGYRIMQNKDVNFYDYFQSYIDNYTKKDIRMMQIALQRFRDFMKDNKTYNIYEHRIKPNQLTKDMMKDFVVYLESRSEGEGARSIYQRFKKVVTYAVEHGVMSNNPCNGVSIKVDGQRLRKDVLSLSEIDQLINTHYRYENPQVRNAFIFCLYTGLRFCDVKTLTYGNVDYQNKMLNFEQHKTKGHSQNSGVIIPLNDGLLSLIGRPKTDNISEELIFELPTYESCCKSVKRWVKRAGINKHISWHCARHSFATNILDNGANIVTVANLLGHSGLKHTEKYLRAIDDRKREAINSLPELKI